LIAIKDHDSGAGDGHLVANQITDPRQDFRRDGVKRERMIGGAIPKAEKVYASRAVGSQSLGIDHLTKM